MPVCDHERENHRAVLAGGNVCILRPSMKDGAIIANNQSCRTGCKRHSHNRAQSWEPSKGRDKYPDGCRLGIGERMAN